jgi:hypothetical protein
MRRLWHAHQVAEALGLTPGAFSARRRRLEEEHGFPPPVAGVGRRWDPAAIEAWLDAQRPRKLAGGEDLAAELVRRAHALRPVA